MAWHDFFWSKKSIEFPISDGEKQIIKEARMAGINTPGKFWDYAFGEQKNSAGQTVDENTALWLSAFYRGIAIRCDSLNLPISVIKTVGNDRFPVTKSDNYEYRVEKLLSVSPNRMMTPSMFYQLLEMSRLMYGNGYAEVHRNGLGVPTALIWHHPDRIKVKKGNVELFYDILDDSGTKIKGVSSMDMIHVKNTSFDGVMGKPILDVAAESLGFGLALQETGNQYFADGMTNKVVLSHPGVLGVGGQKNLKTSFDKEMKDGNTVVLEEGLKPFMLSITPEQSQFLQSREFSVSDVSRWLNVPEFMLANNDPTYSNIENFASHYITHTMRPTVRLYEQEFNWKLLTNDEDFKTRFNLDALNRASLQARAEYYGKAAGGPWMSRNEVRNIENQNSEDGFDKILTPLNYTTNPGGSENNE